MAGVGLNYEGHVDGRSCLVNQGQHLGRGDAAVEPHGVRSSFDEGLQRGSNAIPGSGSGTGGAELEGHGGHNGQACCCGRANCRHGLAQVDHRLDRNEIDPRRGENRDLGVELSGHLLGGSFAKRGEKTSRRAHVASDPQAFACGLLGQLYG